MKAKQQYEVSYSVEESLSLGKCEAFIPSLRNQNPERYKQYVAYGDGDFVEGYSKIWKEYEEKLQEFISVYFFAKETRCIKMSELYAKAGHSKGLVFYQRMGGMLPQDPFKMVKEFDKACEGLIDAKNKWLDKCC